MFYRCFSRVREWQHAGMIQVTRQVLHLIWSVLNGFSLASAASVAWGTMNAKLFLRSMSSLFCSALQCIAKCHVAKPGWVVPEMVLPN